MYEYRTLFIHIEFLDFKIWQYFFHIYKSQTSINQIRNNGFNKQLQTHNLIRFFEEKTSRFVAIK